MLHKIFFLLLTCLQAMSILSASPGDEILSRPSPPGPYVKKVSANMLKKNTFTNSMPIVGTYYFYWYDSVTKAHFIDYDGTEALTRHPIDPKGYSYKLPSWHYRQLRGPLQWCF